MQSKAPSERNIVYMEIKQAGAKTYYIEGNTNVGIYKTDEEKVCLIDTGSEGDGEKIDKLLCERGWKLEYILNTHTHIDHIGGNKYLMDKYDVPAYCTDYDMTFAHYSELEAAYMNGGYPPEKLRKIFRHPGMIGFKTLEENTFDWCSWTYLPGHSFGMVGIKTDDGVWFLGDAYLGRRLLDRNPFGFIYNVEAYLETLDKVKNLEGNLFIPSHGEIEEDISEIAEMNKANVLGIADRILDICSDYTGFDHILKGMYEQLRIRARAANQALLGSTTKSYLTYLQDSGKIEYKFIDHIMKWKTKDF